MNIRIATPEDAPAIWAIYAPIVRNTAISFELEAPTIEEIGSRVSLPVVPWSKRNGLGTGIQGMHF